MRDDDPISSPTCANWAGANSPITCCTTSRNTPTRQLQSALRRIFAGRPPTRRQLDRWQHGRTGIPLVDAGMRELWHTGWMHNRVRMIVASFLTKNLRQHWHHGARWFWDTLVDADLANNTLGWQWVAGCGADAAPYFRVFNPVTQAQEFDPEGTYLRRWLPELADLPDALVHEPWKDPATCSRAPAIPPRWSTWPHRAKPPWRPTSSNAH